ncbi:MAG: PEP-CTERM sorting domain-containing protein [Pseudohongiellaceae bacterium]
MKRTFKRTAIAAALIAATQAATAAPLFDEDVTPDVIFGSGNANGSFTVDRTTGLGPRVELGLRGKLRHNAAGNPENTFNSNGDGTYSFNPGVAPGESFPTAEWSFEWSINTAWESFDDAVDDESLTSSSEDELQDSSDWNLDSLTYQLELPDGTSFDPINVPLADHAIGDNSTGNGGGTEASNDAEYATLIASNNVAQNSWKPHWFVSGFDPTAEGTYSFALAAFDGDTQLARTSMDILVGDGGAGDPSPVPLPGTLLLLGLGFGGLGIARRKKHA